jgi:hypothetical protein
MAVTSCTRERPDDATVVVRAMDIAGARHEVLPPRMILDGGASPLRLPLRALP